MKPLENIIERGDRFVEEVHRAKARQIVSVNVADRIATRGCNSECTAVLLPLPPMEIRELVEEELHNSNAVTAEFVR
ncbi:hypothetical protein V6N13_122300 [Hibiscus sabdariffa]